MPASCLAQASIPTFLMRQRLKTFVLCGFKAIRCADEGSASFVSLSTPNCKLPGMPPCGRINATLDESMETRIRPVHNPPHPPVFNRIPMDIFHVSIEILLVGYKMRPEATLPDATFPSLMAAFRNAFALLQRSRESPLKQIPTRRKIWISRRERPNAMQMIRHDDHRVHMERPLILYVTKRFAQQVDFLSKQIIATALGGIDGEKPSCAGNIKSTICGHEYYFGSHPNDALPSSAHPMGWGDSNLASLQPTPSPHV